MAAQSNKQTDNDEDIDFEISSSKEKSRVPPEVIEAFGAIGLPTDFVATLYKMTNGNKSPAIEGSWEGYCPTLDEIGNQFGAGSYTLVIEYQDDKESAKKKIKFQLGESYNDKFIRAQQVKRAIQLNPTNGQNDFDKMLDMQLKLKQLQGNSGQSDMMPIVTLVMGFMTQMNQQTQQMIQVLTQNKPEPKSLESEIKNLVALKDALGFGNPVEKVETMGDKLVDAGIEMFKVMAPEIVKKLNNPILAPITVRELNKRPEFLEMKENPDTVSKVKAFLTANFPKKQADTAIEKAGLNGP